MENIEKLSKDVFTSSYGREIKQAVKKLREVSVKIFQNQLVTEKAEKLSRSVVKKLEAYDKDVAEFVAARMFDAWHPEKNIGIDSVVHFGIQVQDTHNTDPRQVIRAIEDAVVFAEKELQNPEYKRG